MMYEKFGGLCMYVLKVRAMQVEQLAKITFPQSVIGRTQETQSVQRTLGGTKCES